MDTGTDSQNGIHRPPLRIALVGLGRAALFNHLPALKQLPELYQITAVCDLLRFSDGSEIVTPEPSHLPAFGEKGAA